MSTIIQKQNQKAISQKMRVCEMLNWDVEQYHMFQYETGINYLTLYIPNDPYGVDQLTRSRIFWAWWKNAWSQRDENFINNANALWAPEYCATIYQLENDPYYLVKNSSPNSIVLELTYAQMIQEFIDEINQPL